MSADAVAVAAETPEGLPLPASDPAEPLSMGAVLRIIPMRRLWYAQVVSVFGDFLALYAVMTIVTYKLHATPQQVTGIQIAYLAPIAILGIISGVFADRWPVKVTLVASDLTRAALCLLLLVVHSMPGFYAVLAAISVVSSFFSPAQGIAVRSAVPFHGLRSANALMQQVLYIMRILGGPIAVTIVTVLGVRVCYVGDSISFVASASLIASIALTIPARSAVANPAPDSAVAAELSGIRRIAADMREGASFILHHTALLFVVSALAAGLFSLGCFAPMIAVYVRDNLHAPQSIFGVTSAMIGIGLLAGINVLTAAAKKVQHTSLVYFGLGGMAVGTFILAGIPLLAATIPALILVGFAAGGIIVPSQTLIQEETPPAMLGRVGSTVMSFVFSAQIAGLLLSGVLAQHTSVRGVFLLSGILLAVLMLAGKLWMEPNPHQPLEVTAG
ncbi:MAG TPA: MFS transporter [Acidobacteriaceae bacterium]|nr:MFS transporter [Acidobacteriaceae bacterium]